MKTALVTASYHKDFERCKLLCETVDRHVSGFTNHYILVEPRDVPLFRQAYDVVETHLDIFQDVFVRAIRQKQDDRREADIEIRSASYRLDELALGFIAHFIMDEKLKHGAGRERDET